MTAPAPGAQAAAVFDRAAVRRARDRAAPALADHDFLFARAAAQIADRLRDIRRDFPLALQIGARGDCACFRIGTLVRLDAAFGLLPPDAACVQAEEDFLPFASGTFDLVVSPPALHAVNDLPGALAQIRRVLKPDGVFLGALFGGQTLHELRGSLMSAEMAVKGGASPRVFPFADARQAGALLQRAGFALPVVDSDTVTVTYDGLPALMRDLRGMGETNAAVQRSRTPPGKALMAEAARIYARDHADPDGRLRATFETIHLIGWAPHESQPRPLRPGSAERSLAEALAAPEKEEGRTT